jgi:hypothetical protein
MRGGKSEERQGVRRPRTIETGKAMYTTIVQGANHFGHTHYMAVVAASAAERAAVITPLVVLIRRLIGVGAIRRETDPDRRGNIDPQIPATEFESCQGLD